MQRETLGSDHPNVGFALARLATCYSEKHNYAKEEQLLGNSMAIFQNAVKAKRIEPNDPRLARCIKLLGVCLAAEGRHREAESYFKQALSNDEKSLTSDDIQIAEARTRLATCYYSEGKFAQAEPLFRRALLTLEKKPGLYHDLIVANLGALANTLLQQDKKEESANFTRRLKAFQTLR